MRTRYWIASGLGYIGLVFGCVFLPELLSMLVGSSDMQVNWQEFGNNWILNAVVMGPFVLCIAIGIQYSVEPMTVLRFGATRKECLIGMWIQRLMMFLPIYGAVFGGALLRPVDLGRLLVLTTVFCLLSASIGMTVGSCVSRFASEKPLYWVLMLALGAFVGGVCVGLGELPNLVNETPKVHWAVLPGSIAVFLISLFIENRNLQRVSVH